MKKFSPKGDDNEKFWLEVIIATFMDAVDRRRSHNTQ